MDSTHVLWVIFGRRTTGSIHVAQHGVELCLGSFVGSSADHCHVPGGGLVWRLSLRWIVVADSPATCAGCLSVYRQWILLLSLGIRALRLYPFLDTAPDSLGITSRSGVGQRPVRHWQRIAFALHRFTVGCNGSSRC